MAIIDAHVLEAAERSARRVADHDRSGWIGLFTRDGRVADPVGSQPHVGTAAIGRFYDTFIGPREVVFRPDVDIVAGSTVIRDLTLQVSMGPVVQMTIPAILRYEIAHDTDTASAELKIAELHAYWELPPMMRQFARNGTAAVMPGLGLARSMLSNQGVAGSVGFLRGFRRPGRRSHAVHQEVLTALSAGNELAVRRLLGQRTELNVTLDEISAWMRDATWTKVLGAGRTITASIRSGDRRGVVITDFFENGLIDRMQLFH